MSWFADGRSRRRRTRAWLREDLPSVLLVAVSLSIAVAVPLVGIYHRDGGFEPVPVVSPRPDDPPPGTCVASLPGPDGPADVVSCAVPHRGEILGYRPVGTGRSGNGSPEAMADFECRWLLAAEDLDPGYGVSWSISYSARGDPAAGVTGPRVTCVLHRSGAGELLPAGRIAAVEPHDAGTGITVPMPWFGTSDAESIPVGICVGKGLWDNLTVGFAPDPAPAARCEGFRVARVVGRPELAPPGTPWPGADVAAATADGACRRLPIRFRPLEILVVVPPEDAGRWASPGRGPQAVCLARVPATP